MVHKNEDILKSVSSIDPGAIFLPRSSQDLSRNAFVVSIPFPGRISHWRIDFFHALEKCDFLIIFRSFSRSARELPGSFQDLSRVSGGFPEVPGAILGSPEHHPKT